MSAVASGDENDLYSSPVVEHQSADGEGTEAAVVQPKEVERPADFDKWAPCKKQAWLQMEANPNAFFYRHVLPDEERKNGPWTESEKELFLKVLEEHPPETGHWGLFARHIPGRVGYQCNAFYKKLVAAGAIPGMPPKENVPAPTGSTDRLPPRRSSRADEIERAKAMERCKKDMEEYKYMYDFSANDCFHYSPKETEPAKPCFRDTLRSVLATPENRELFVKLTDRFDYLASLS